MDRFAEALLKIAGLERKGLRKTGLRVRESACEVWQRGEVRHVVALLKKALEA